MSMNFLEGSLCAHGQFEHIKSRLKMATSELGMSEGVVTVFNESTEVPNARLYSAMCCKKKLNTRHFLVVYSYSGTEVVLNRPGYICATTYTVA